LHTAALADDATTATKQTQPATESDGAKSALSPLEQLKQRSPSERWHKRSKDWLAKRRATQQTSDETPDAAPSPQAKPVAAVDSANPSQKATPNQNPSTDRQTAPRLPDGSIKLLPVTDVEKSWSQYVAFRKQPSPEYPEPVRNPKLLKSITSIQPYADYEPNAATRKSSPCSNLCPRPDGKPCDVAPEGLIQACPEEVPLSDETFEGRSFSDSVFQWVASDVYYNPLYFEDVALERYGHTHGDMIQPFVSVGKFGVQLLGLPYAMTIDPVRKKMYPLGFYRPGECAPKKYYQIPWNTESALREAGVWTALVFIFP